MSLRLTTWTIVGAGLLCVDVLLSHVSFPSSFPTRGDEQLFQASDGSTAHDRVARRCNAGVGQVHSCIDSRFGAFRLHDYEHHALSHYTVVCRENCRFLFRPELGSLRRFHPRRGLGLACDATAARKRQVLHTRAPASPDHDQRRRAPRPSQRSSRLSTRQYSNHTGGEPLDHQDGTAKIQEEEFNTVAVLVDLPAELDDENKVLDIAWADPVIRINRRAAPRLSLLGWGGSAREVGAKQMEGPGRAGPSVWSMRISMLRSCRISLSATRPSSLSARRPCRLGHWPAAC